MQSSNRQEDFNWDQFKEDLEEFHQDATHIFLPVKVPIDMKQTVTKAIRRARENGALPRKTTHGWRAWLSCRSWGCRRAKAISREG